MAQQSDIARRADAIERELTTRTARLAKDLQGEFDQDDAKSVTDRDFHEMVRRNWSDPNWRVSTAQRMGPVALYKAALEAFGRNLDGSPSVDSHKDALAAEPTPTELQVPDTKPDTNQAPSPPLPNVFPFQGPSLPRQQPGMPPPPLAAPPPPTGAPVPPPVGPPPPMAVQNGPPLQ